MEKTHNSEKTNIEDLVDRMKKTSTTKKKFEKILNIKRTFNITFEMSLLTLNVFLVFLSLSSSDYINISIISGLVGVSTSIFIIYNKYIINIDELLYKNRTSYLMIDSIFKNTSEENYIEAYKDYEKAVSIVDNIPDFIYHLTQNEKILCSYFKLTLYLFYEYIVEILILVFIILFPY